MKHTNIYIVDDSLTIRAMMQSLIEQDNAFEICGIAANAEVALDEISSSKPEIVLLDLSLPTLDGLTFLDRVQEQIHDPWSAMKVIVVSASAKHDAPVCTDAFDRGAVACFDKSCVVTQSSEFMTLLHEVSKGQICRYNHPGHAVTLPLWMASDDDCDCLEDNEDEDEDEDHEDVNVTRDGRFAVRDDKRDLPGSLTFI